MPALGLSPVRPCVGAACIVHPRTAGGSVDTRGDWYSGRGHRPRPPPHQRLQPWHTRETRPPARIQWAGTTPPLHGGGWATERLGDGAGRVCTGPGRPQGAGPAGSGPGSPCRQHRALDAVLAHRVSDRRPAGARLVRYRDHRSPRAGPAGRVPVDDRPESVEPVRTGYIASAQANRQDAAPYRIEQGERTARAHCWTSVCVTKVTFFARK